MPCHAMLKGHGMLARVIAVEVLVCYMNVLRQVHWICVASLSWVLIKASLFER